MQTHWLVSRRLSFHNLWPISAAQIFWRAVMSQGLFAISASARKSTGYLGGGIPYLTIDGIFERPEAVRRAALELQYSAGTAHYPGRVARFPDGDPSLTAFLGTLVDIVVHEYIPLLMPVIGGNQQPRVRGADTDFAITDKHPSELSDRQRKPHIDAVPVFGLVYLNEVPRGGTLFFKPRSETEISPNKSGYPRAGSELELSGQIEGRFNRLAIYPGFVLHSGEIDGDWIEREERLAAPRLTQRIMFFF